MRFFAAFALLLVVACTSNQQKINADSAVTKPAANATACQQFYDSLISIADTAETLDNIEAYTPYYTKKEVNNTKYHFTYTQLTFNTGDAAWDKQLNHLFDKKIKDALNTWIRDNEETLLDTSEDGMWDRVNHSIEITPLFVSKKWLTVEYKTEGYYGGAHALWEGNYYHYYNNNGRLQQVKQPDIFVYDNDTSTRQRYYHTIFKGMDNEVNVDTVFALQGCEYSALYSFEQYIIYMRPFTMADDFTDDSFEQEYYLIPAKTGLKTKNYYSDIGNGANKTGYKPNMVIPYKSLKGIVQEKYLKVWMENGY